MMTPDQVQTVTKVFRKFCENDTKDTTEWTEIDECMSILDWLADDRLAEETELRLLEHKRGTPQCPVDHPGKECFVPIVIDAVTAILELYKSTNSLHPNNRYILQYYMSLSSIGAIISR